MKSMSGKSNVALEDSECPVCKLFGIEPGCNEGPLSPVTPKGELNWSAMPGRIHVVDEVNPLPVFGMFFTFVGMLLLGIVALGLAVTGGVVLAQALRHAGLHSHGLLHQLHARLN
jgi:hypothetical protein